MLNGVNETFGCTALTGGAAGAVDALPSARLGAGDLVIAVSGGVVYKYGVNATSGAAENSPLVIKPDDVGSGNKRLELLDFMATDITAKGALVVDGYSQLGGSSAPAIKCKKLTGTTAAAEGGSVSVAHGLTASKIISVTTIVTHTANAGIPHAYVGGAGYQYDFIFNSTNVVVVNHATNSENILSKSFIATIFYEE